jgi:2-polyprenyl-6-methoxyphenol hydroxylase-like FAD-dependent oxidoreductase
LRKAEKNIPEHMTRSKTFAIVGAGIGGLTTAIALQRKGFKVIVYESAPAIKALGAGIVLAANAMKALQAIDMERAVLTAGRELRRFAIKDARGFYLNTTEAERINQKYGLVNTLTLHRADLHQVLLSALSPGIVSLDKTCIDFKQLNDGRVELIFADGSTSKEECVIACDGIHSVFRKKLTPNSRIRYSGYTCWRSVVESESLSNDEATETWGAGKRFGIVPLSGGRVYWYATLNAPLSDTVIRKYSINDLVNVFRQFHAPVNEVLAATKPERLIQSDISDFIPLTQYAFNNIVLTGDAAHATTPNLGQGACMAIEDGVTLANCIAKSDDVASAFRLFESLRVGRNTRIVNASYSLGKVAQLKNPLLAQLRNQLMKIAPESVAEKQLRFLYDISFS